MFCPSFPDRFHSEYSVVSTAYAPFRFRSNRLQRMLCMTSCILEKYCEVKKYTGLPIRDIRCKDGLSPGFPAAPERDVYDHSALPVFPRHFRTFRTRFTKVPAEGKLRQVCRSFVSLIHMFPCCFLVRIWLLDLGFMFLVCFLTCSLGL